MQTFMPRIKNYKKQRFYFPKGCTPPPELEPLFHDTIDGELIAEQWDNPVRVAASLKHRLGSTHVIAKRLINSSPSNRLAKALTRIIHGSIYCEAKLPAILGRPRHSMLVVSGDTTARLIPAGAQAWQPLWLLMTKNP